MLVTHTHSESNWPKIRDGPTGKGREIMNAQKADAMQRREQKASMMMTILFFIVGLSVLLSITWSNPPQFRPEILLLGILVAGIIWMATRYTGHRQENVLVPKLLVSHSPDELP